MKINEIATAVNEATEDATPFIKATAKVLASSVEAYHLLKHDKSCEKALREQILVIIRYATNHLPFDPLWSENVAALAKQKGIDIKRWARNPKMGQRFLGGKTAAQVPPEERVTYEHMVTVSQMMRAVIATPEDAAKILSMARIVWITAAEDKALRDAGFLKDRADPEKAYAQVGIKIAR